MTGKMIDDVQCWLLLLKLTMMLADDFDDQYVCVKCLSVLLYRGSGQSAVSLCARLSEVCDVTLAVADGGSFLFLLQLNTDIHLPLNSSYRRVQT
jgi:hypothetical protein